ncbi:heat-inducible transcriptional repressor HrcA [Limisalsivibrio acetivorans]|uniref:heat-inducible transcriptional repressor HrcA n=1 Tax=Limisalsivibrio acetivorans TaxID=1304888 RepID=UPI0003B6A391|nr:heat-inducible transcriptional repressor HrcA [Limisalsivibrio acetivorans]
MSFLNEREESVLKTIIEEYVKTSEPVGSRYISKSGPLRLSAATIRNIMSDLEEKGLIEQPHTSAGRVPSDSGYRYYIDKLVTFGSIEDDLVENFMDRNAPSSVNDFFKGVSQKMSKLTNSIGFVVTPKLNTMHLKHIEFLPFNPTTVIAIIVTKSGIVHNVLLDMEKPVDPSALVRASNYLNEHFQNKSLQEVRLHILDDMREKKEKMDNLFTNIYDIGNRIFSNEDFGTEIYVEGTSNVLGMPEFTDVKKLKELYSIFEEKHFFGELLDRCTREKGVQIFVGSEIGKEEIAEMGLVSNSYTRGGQIVGSLGIIGPKRMSYPKVVSVVDYTSVLITKMLEKLSE